MCILQINNNDLNLQVDSYVFEKVKAFKYLGININNKNNIYEEIKERVDSANICYYSLLKLFKSKLLSRESKVTLYKSYMRLVLTYGCEMWATTKGEHSKLSTTERKVLRKIFNPVYKKQTPRLQNNCMINCIQWFIKIWNLISRSYRM